MKIPVSNLPSLGIPYSFTEIELERIGVPQIMLLSKAVSLQSIKPAVEAVDSLLNVTAGELTDGDFFYLLTVLRLGYTKPLYTQWHCNEILYYTEDKDGAFYTKQGIKDLVKEYESADDKKDLIDPDKLRVIASKCAQYNKHILTLDDLEIRFLNNEPLPEGLDYPRVESLADSMVEQDDPEMFKLAQAIRWFKTESRTYKAKKEFFNNLSDLALLEHALFCKNTISHGIRKKVICSCTKCGAESTHVLEIGPETFFDI